MAPPDLFQRLAAPFREPLERWLVAVLPGQAGLVGPLLDVAGVALVGVVLAGLCGALTRRAHAAAPESPRAPQHVPPALQLAAGVVAAGLFAWIVRHPGTQLESLFGRGDHLLLCAAIGLAVAPLPPAWRKRVLAALSMTVLLQYVGPVSVGLAAATGLAGVALLRAPFGERAWLHALVQGALLAAAYGCALWVRQRHFLLAGSIQGLLAFVALRHISFATVAWRTPRPLADYAAYMSFYPGAAGMFGAAEVYPEFARRNLAGRVTIDYPRARRRSVEGAALVWLSLVVPGSLDAVLASPSPLVAWGQAVVFYLKRALYLMGGWAAIEAAALFMGVQLRANFRGLLTCQNPSEFWWAWRGSLTNWLVQHVYGPLGARRRLTRNILAAFGVSLLWHAVGVPFVTRDFAPVQVTPVALWAAINAIAVLIHAHVAQGGAGKTPPGRVRRAVHIAMVWVLAAMTPLLLSFQGEAFDRFPALVRALFGASWGLAG